MGEITIGEENIWNYNIYKLKFFFDDGDRLQKLSEKDELFTQVIRLVAFWFLIFLDYVRVERVNMNNLNERNYEKGINMLPIVSYKFSNKLQ